MDRGKEQWINKALNSLNGLQAAKPPVGMHGKIMQRVQAERFRIMPDRVSKATIYRAAAAILIILTMNVVTCVAFHKSVTVQKQLQSFAKEYSLDDNSDEIINM